MPGNKFLIETGKLSLTPKNPVGRRPLFPTFRFVKSGDVGGTLSGALDWSAGQEVPIQIPLPPTDTPLHSTRDQQRRHGDGMEDPPTDGGVTATYIRNSDKMYIYSRRVDKFVWIRRLPYVAVRTPELASQPDEAPKWFVLEASNEYASDIKW
ncbi:unnamed protein product [Boreogadus saida]